MTGNGKLCKIYFKRLFLQNVLAFIDLFYWYHYISHFIFSNCMWRHVYLICTEEAITGGVLEHFANFTGKATIKRKPTTIELIVHNTPHTLNYATSLMLGLSGSSQTPGVTHLPFSSHQKQKDKTLYSLSLLILLSYTKNQEKNSSIR